MYSGSRQMSKFCTHAYSLPPPPQSPSVHALNHLRRPCATAAAALHRHRPPAARTRYRWKPLRGVTTESAPRRPTLLGTASGHLIPLSLEAPLPACSSRCHSSTRRPALRGETNSQPRGAFTGRPSSTSIGQPRRPPLPRPHEGEFFVFF
jgi:hypothetical protein